MANIKATPSVSEEIELWELWNLLWLEKWTLVIVTGFFAFASVSFALMQTNIYRAEIVLAPAEARQSASPLVSQLGGAAALIGINVGSQGGDRITNALAILQSREFLLRFIYEHDILIPLFAGTWSIESGSGVDQNIYDISTAKWLLENGAPTDMQAYRAFTSILSVSQDAANGLIRVSIDWHDPAVAAQWINQMVSDINRNIKDTDVKEATNAINYLRVQLESTQLVDMQRVFYQLIESQTRVVMLADVRDEYVFQVIDPAIPSDQKIAPSRALIAIVGTMAGVGLALMIVFVRRLFRSPQAN
jgi:uncharacterized protein involved in exopolysaccharide biosynthesis